MVKEQKKHCHSCFKQTKNMVLTRTQKARLVTKHKYFARKYIEACRKSRMSSDTWYFFQKSLAIGEEIYGPRIVSKKALAFRATFKKHN